MKTIRKLLVPNRGEIAIRIARTCREMGVGTVLGHAEDERGSYPARFFDELVSLGSGEARETYLNVGRVIDAARASGADAIHPGYGFLSERAELAAGCRDAGITFIGPRPEAIDLMGSKSASRQLMQKLGVPVVPGYDGDDQSVARLVREAETIGFPLLVKASAGGGGKGMKIVKTPAALGEALDSARRESAKAFGNDHLLLERYIERPRHIEFQIVGDSRGTILHLFERDCSIQRRHQKVVEESPAPRLHEELRARMGAAAVTAARGVQYENAGTIEFILVPSGEFYFLEMNTRLQVEHPVTELVLGVDLVRAQIAIAAGEPLPWKDGTLRPRGHAIECRVYAEDPESGFLPQIGTIEEYREPGGPGIRVDSGVTAGSTISVKYDPMLAKVIAYSESREGAIDRLARALRDYVILGTRTNVSWLRRVIEHRDFRDGAVHTGFLADHQDDLMPKRPGEVAAIAAVLAAQKKPARAGGTTAPTPSSVWDTLGDWRG